MRGRCGARGQPDPRRLAPHDDGNPAARHEHEHRHEGDELLPRRRTTATNHDRLRARTTRPIDHRHRVLHCARRDGRSAELRRRDGLRGLRLDRRRRSRGHLSGHRKRNRHRSARCRATRHRCCDRRRGLEIFGHGNFVDDDRWDVRIFHRCTRRRNGVGTRRSVVSVRAPRRLAHARCNLGSDLVEDLACADGRLTWAHGSVCVGCVCRVLADTERRMQRVEVDEARLLRGTVLPTRSVSSCPAILRCMRRITPSTSHRA